MEAFRDEMKHMFDGFHNSRGMRVVILEKFLFEKEQSQGEIWVWEVERWQLDSSDGCELAGKAIKKRKWRAAREMPALTSLFPQIFPINST